MAREKPKSNRRSHGRVENSNSVFLPFLMRDLLSLLSLVIASLGHSGLYSYASRLFTTTSEFTSE